MDDKILSFYQKISSDADTITPETQEPPAPIAETPQPTPETTPAAPPPKAAAPNFTPPSVEAPKSSDAPPPPPAAPVQTVTDEQAETYALMYTNSLNFVVSLACSFMTGNPAEKYEANKEQRQQVTAGAKEFFKTSNIAVTPGFYMFLTTVTVFGLISFRAYLDYKAKKAEEKRERERLERIEAQKRQQAKEAEQRAQSAKEREMQSQYQEPPPAAPAAPLKVVHRAQTEAPAESMEVINKPNTALAAFEGVTKADIENLTEVIKNRRCFELDPAGFYLLKEDRGYYKKSEAAEKYKPSIFVKKLIDRYAAQAESGEAAKVNLLVRKQLDELKKELGINSPVIVPAKRKAKPIFEH